MTHFFTIFLVQLLWDGGLDIQLLGRNVMLIIVGLKLIMTNFTHTFYI